MCANDTRSRAWCFTWNNYPDDAVDRLKGIPCERMVVGREVGESGTPHLQGYVRFKQPQRFSYWKNGWPQVHVESRKGSEAQAASYCQKGGDVVIDVGVNFDEKVGPMTRAEELEMIFEEADKGASYGQIRQRHRVFCFWNRSKVINEVCDARYYMEHGVEDDPFMKYDDFYKNKASSI